MYTLFLIVEYYPCQQVTLFGSHYFTRKRTLATFRNSCIRIFSKTPFSQTPAMVNIFENTIITSIFENFQSIVFSRKYSLCYFFENICLKCLRKFSHPWSYFSRSSSKSKFSHSPIMSILEKFFLFSIKFYRKHTWEFFFENTLYACLR